MSEVNNKAILKKGNSAILNGNNEGMLSLCSEDTEWTFVGVEILKGKEAVRQYMASVYMEPPKFTVTNLIAEGDYVSALGEIALNDKNGKEIHYSYCDVWRFRNNQIVELKAFVIKNLFQKL